LFGELKCFIIHVTAATSFKYKARLRPDKLCQDNGRRKEGRKKERKKENEKETGRKRERKKMRKRQEERKKMR
jgi:hypothetical protein